GCRNTWHHEALVANPRSGDMTAGIGGAIRLAGGLGVHIVFAWYVGWLAVAAPTYRVVIRARSHLWTKGERQLVLALRLAAGTIASAVVYMVLIPMAMDCWELSRRSIVEVNGHVSVSASIFGLYPIYQAISISSDGTRARKVYYYCGGVRVADRTAVECLVL